MVPSFNRMRSTKHFMPNLIVYVQLRRRDINRELKHQTFSRGRRQPEVKFTSYPRFPPTGSAVATLRRLCFAYFDVACKT